MPLFVWTTEEIVFVCIFVNLFKGFTVSVVEIQVTLTSLLVCNQFIEFQIYCELLTGFSLGQE